MNIESASTIAASNNLLTGVTILLLLLIPIAMIYWIHSVITPSGSAPDKPKSPAIIRFKPKTLKYCNNHLTNLPKNRIALVVGASRCDLCKGKGQT